MLPALGKAQSICSGLIYKNIPNLVMLLTSISIWSGQVIVFLFQLTTFIKLLQMQKTSKVTGLC